MRKTTAYARKRAHKDAFARTRHEVINPVTEAVNPSCIRDILKQRVYKLPPPPTTSAGSGKGE